MLQMAEGRPFSFCPSRQPDLNQGKGAPGFDGGVKTYIVTWGLLYFIFERRGEARRGRWARARRGRDEGRIDGRKRKVKSNPFRPFSLPPSRNRSRRKRGRMGEVFS